MRERHACRLTGLGRSTHRYRARKAERNSEPRTRLKELAAKRMRFGYRRLRAMLLRKGMPANHKRVYRLYREEGWAMSIRRRRRIRWRKAVTKPASTRPNERWSMEFVSDWVSTVKAIRAHMHRCSKRETRSLALVNPVGVASRLLLCRERRDEYPPIPLTVPY
jgi:putative transposase